MYECRKGHTTPGGRFEEDSSRTTLPCFKASVTICYKTKKKYIQDGSHVCSMSPPFFIIHVRSRFCFTSILITEEEQLLVLYVLHKSSSFKPFLSTPTSINLPLLKPQFIIWHRKQLGQMTGKGRKTRNIFIHNLILCFFNRYSCLLRCQCCQFVEILIV